MKRFCNFPQLAFVVAVFLTGAALFVYFAGPQSAFSPPENEASVAGAPRPSEANYAVDFARPGGAALQLGELELGAVHTLRIDLQSFGKMPVEAAASSCSCLKILALSSADAGPSRRLTVRYLALRAGSFEVTVALSQRTPAGKEEARMLRLSGMVKSGDPSRAGALLALAAAPSRPVGLAAPDPSLEFPDLFLPAKELVTSGAKAMGVLLVDVREPGKFERAYIAGSVNHSLHTLKTLGFLRNQKIVLLNEGHLDAALAEKAATLRRAGFSSVRVLRGGLPAWRQAGGKLSGVSRDSAMVATLSSPDFYGAQGPEWLIVEVGEESDPTRKVAFVDSVKLPSGQDGESILPALGRLLQSHPTARKLLVASARGEGYETIQHTVKGVLQTPIYYLHEGIKGYLGFLETNSALQARQQVKLTANPERSSAIGAAARSGKPCSTCP